MAKLVKCNGDAKHKHFHQQQKHPLICGAACVDMALGCITGQAAPDGAHIALAMKMEKRKAERGKADKKGVGPNDITQALVELSTPWGSRVIDRDMSTKAFNNGHGSKTIGEAIRNPPKGENPYPVMVLGKVEPVGDSKRLPGLHWVVIAGRVKVTGGTDLFCILDPARESGNITPVAIEKSPLVEIMSVDDDNTSHKLTLLGPLIYVIPP